LGPAAPMVARRVAAPMRGFSARGVLTRVNVSDLALLGDWMSQGSLRVVVAAEFPLAQADEAYRVLEAGGVHGKVAVRVASR
ncbi:hypothetical protein DSM05_15860, partial [Pseudomonas sp. FW305-3-2-15-E-TSA4]|nr:hypothetical protein [Pseudomonas sp. FW305-3-2-15-E-TSA4]